MKEKLYPNICKYMRMFYRIVFCLTVFCFCLAKVPARTFDDQRKGFTLGIGGGPGSALLVYEESLGSYESFLLKYYFSLQADIRMGFGFTNQLNISFIVMMAPSDFEAIWDGYSWFFELGDWLLIAWPLFPFIPVVGSQIFFGPEVTWYFKADAPSWFVTGALGFSLFFSKKIIVEDFTIPAVGGLGIRSGIGYEFKPHVAALFTCTSLLIPHPNAPPGYTVSCAVTINLFVY